MGKARAGLVLIGLLVVAGTAAAQAPSDQARAAYERGDALFLAGKYEDALIELTRAYELSKAPELLFNIAQAQRLGGHCREAVVAYETYLQRAPKGRRRADAQGFLKELTD